VVEGANPTGRFVVGGPQGDCGLTGRKIIVDTYGGACPHGGGAFSGKDPSKVDRSAAYATRYVAKNIVAAGLARQCQVQVAYAIGVAHPMNITVYTEGTGVIPDEQIAKLVQEHFDLRDWSAQEVDFIDWVFNSSAVLRERANLMEQHEGLTYERDAERRQALGMRSSYFVNELTGDLSKPMVKKIQNCYGVEIWPWERTR